MREPICFALNPAAPLNSSLALLSEGESVRLEYSLELDRRRVLTLKFFVLKEYPRKPLRPDSPSELLKAMAASIVPSLEIRIEAVGPILTNFSDASAAYPAVMLFVNPKR